MHCLENTLLILSQRIAAETGNTELADACRMLAGLSHWYVPEDADSEVKSGIAAINDEWVRSYEGLMYSKGPQGKP